MYLNMQIRYVLVFVAIGVFVEGRRDRRFIGDDSVQIRQNQIDDIARKFEETLREFLLKIEQFKQTSVTTWSNDMIGTADKFKEKLQNELEKAKKEGKEVEKTVTCVEKEQKRYIDEFGEKYVEFLTCVKNATLGAKDGIKGVNNTFPHYLVGQHHSNSMYEKWDKCQVPIVNHHCIDTVDAEYMKNIKLAQKSSKEATEKGEGIIVKYKFETKSCFNTLKEEMSEVEEKHKKFVKECKKS